MIRAIHDYWFASVLMALVSLAYTMGFGALWNNSRLAARFDTRLSYKASLTATVGAWVVLLPAYVFLLWKVLG